MRNKTTLFKFRIISTVMVLVLVVFVLSQVVFANDPISVNQEHVGVDIDSVEILSTSGIQVVDTSEYTSLERDGYVYPENPEEDASNTLVIIMVAITIIFILIMLGLTVFWLWCLIHLLRSNSKDKLLWVIILVVTAFLGAFLYYFIGKKEVDAENMSTRHLNEEN